MFESVKERKSFTIWNKLVEFGHQYDTLYNFLQEELVGKLAKFKIFGGPNDWKKEIIDDINLKGSDFFFVCGEAKYKVNMVYAIEYEDIKEDVDEGVPTSFTLWFKYIALDRNPKYLIDFLKTELVGKSVKFKIFGDNEKSPYREDIVDDVEWNNDVIFICGDKKIMPSVLHSIIYNKSKQTNTVWVVGVPSGEAIEVERTKIFNALYNSGLIFFADNYAPTFYGFKDENLGKIRGIINKTMLGDILNKN